MCQTKGLSCRYGTSHQDERYHEMIREIKLNMTDWFVLTADPAGPPVSVMKMQVTNLVQVLETSLYLERSGTWVR